jgi:hypothetical protein
VEARERRFAAGSYDRLRGARAGRMPSEIEDDAAKRVQRAVRTWEARRAVAFRRELVLNLAALCAEEPQLVPRVVRLQAIARGVAVRSFFLRSATAAATSTGEACTQGMGDAQGLSGQGSESMEGGGMVSPDMSPIASPVLEKGGGRMLSEPPTSPISMHQGALYLKGGGGKGGARGGGGGVEVEEVKTLSTLVRRHGHVQTPPSPNRQGEEQGEEQDAAAAAAAVVCVLRGRQRGDRMDGHRTSRRNRSCDPAAPSAPG